MGIVVGFTLFLLTALEEFAVALGWLEFIYLADVGYVFVVAPVAWQQLARFRDDANQLDRLSSALTDEVQRRTEERDSARRVLIEQQRLAALGRLSAGVGHEINNPLQYLRFNLEELQERAGERADAESLDLVTRSLEGVDRIRQVVEDLRTYVRPGSADVSVLDVREVVRSALRVGAPQWHEGISVEAHYGAVPMVEGNEGRLVQVVLNPLVNGAQAMLHAGDPARRTLHVRTYTSVQQEAVIEVRDEGPGFAPALMAQLGEPYVTTKADRGGTGLGLFVTRGIVEAHGGTLQFGNADEGGAWVRIRLPGLSPSDRAPESAPSQIGARGRDHPVGPPTASPLAVLLVEDDAPALRALVRALEAEGLRVTGFTQAAEALVWLDTHAAEVQVVVTDLMMPGMSGWEFARQLATRHPRLYARLVVLTGGAATDEARAFVAESALPVLEKPIARQTLVAALRQRASGAPWVPSVG
jgi:signal transduction histidine kinase/ActR/RegA family two-component response regulator